MSNIHTVDEINAKRKQQQQNNFQGKPRTIGGSSPTPTKSNQNEPYEFKGRARRLDGSYVDPEPEPEPKKEKKKKQPRREEPETTPIGDAYVVYEQRVITSSGLPPELQCQFWSANTENLTCCNACLLSYCPCFVGECCSEARKSEWKQFFLKFTLYCMIVQLIMYIITLCDTPSLDWMLEPSVPAVIHYGAISTYKIRYDYEIWRVISYMFLHGSWFHILFNSLAQFTFCLGVEKAWGLIRYLIIYFATGIIGGLFSSMWSANKVSVGASCAIFGTMGAYFAIILIYWSQIPDISKFSLGTWMIMLPVLFICVSFLPNVDYAGHLGGVLGGLALGFLVYWNKSEQRFKYYFLGAGIVLLVICIAVPFAVIYTRG